MVTTSNAEDGAAETPAAEPAADARIARQLRAFVAAHGEPAAAVVNYLGRRGARIVVTAADGLYADAMLPSVRSAVLTCEEAGVDVENWTRELTSRITLSPAQRRRMARIGRPGI